MEALIPPAAVQSSTAHGCSNVAQHTAAGQCQSWPPVPADLPSLPPQPCLTGSSYVAEKPEKPPGAPICFYSQLVPPQDEVTQKIWLFLGVLHFVSPGQAMPELAVHVTAQPAGINCSTHLNAANYCSCKSRIILSAKNRGVHQNKPAGGTTDRGQAPGCAQSTAIQLCVLHPLL